MQIFFCFLTLFSLTTLMFASMDSFFTNIFSEASVIPVFLGLPLFNLIQKNYKEIKG